MNTRLGQTALLVARLMLVVLLFSMQYYAFAHVLKHEQPLGQGELCQVCAIAHEVGSAVLPEVALIVTLAIIAICALFIGHYRALFNPYYQFAQTRAPPLSQ